MLLNHLTNQTPINIKIKTYWTVFKPGFNQSCSFIICVYAAPTSMKSFIVNGFFQFCLSSQNLFQDFQIFNSCCHICLLYLSLCLCVLSFYTSWSMWFGCPYFALISRLKTTVSWKKCAYTYTHQSFGLWTPKTIKARQREKLNGTCKNYFSEMQDYAKNLISTRGKVWNVG